MDTNYIYASDGNGPAVRATITQDRLPTDMDIITDTVLNWPHNGIATSGTPDVDGVIIPGTECVFSYVLSGSIIHIENFQPGYSDLGNTENQIVILKPVTAWSDLIADSIDLKADLDSPALTGTPTAPTQTAGDNSTKIATTAYVGAMAYDNMPIGAGIDYWGATLPSSNWMFAYGQAISRTTYAALFALMGTTFGAGDGSTTFNLPDARGRVIAGKDNMGGTSANRLTGASGGVDGDVLGGTGGTETHTLTVSEIPSHRHEYKANLVHGDGEIVTAEYINAGLGYGTVRRRYADITGYIGGGGAHNNVQPTMVANYIIKVS